MRKLYILKQNAGDNFLQCLPATGGGVHTFPRFPACKLLIEREIWASSAIYNRF
jgi:hypothetical protein